jgi:acylphosphatase
LPFGSVYTARSEAMGDRSGMSGTITIRVRITGRVQGVWYRGWTIDQARRLGLAGWVRNRLDGSVEAVFSGPKDAVRAMIDRCRQGPPGAMVSRLTEQIETAPVDPGFRQAPTV